MINSVNQSAAAALGGTSGGTTPAVSTGGGFDAALKAAQKAEADRKAHASELESIKTKGFSNWVRDTQMEKLKEELRKRVMAEMGVSEDDLSKLSSVMREILEKKIQEEVDKRMQEETAKQQDEQNGGKTASLTKQAEQQTGKNDRNGKDCPVIPALSWPGGASVF